MRLIDADEYKKRIEGKSAIAKFLFEKGIISETAAKVFQILKKDIDEQPTVSAAAISGKTETGAKKITTFRPHEEIRIYINDKMMQDWIKCREYLDNEINPPDGMCYSCELYRDIYPGAAGLCDVPEIRKALKEWTGYGND